MVITHQLDEVMMSAMGDDEDDARNAEGRRIQVRIDSRRCVFFRGESGGRDEQQIQFWFVSATPHVDVAPMPREFDEGIHFFGSEIHCCQLPVVVFSLQW